MVYPTDVLRRRFQVDPDAVKRYGNSFRGLWMIYKEEGVRNGLYRGITLNYLKAAPNTTIYLLMFDWLKMQ